jgi:hypothetical protein
MIPPAPSEGKEYSKGYIVKFSIMMGGEKMSEITPCEDTSDER